MEDNKQDKKNDFSLKLFGVSVLIYIGIQTLLALLDVFGGMDIPKWGYFLISFPPALYFYQTQKKKKIDGENENTKNVNKKISWKLFGLSLLVYYISVMSINIILSLAEIDYRQYRFYPLIASVIAAIYFYQKRKETGALKKDVIWIGMAGVIVSLLMILSYI